MFDRGDDEFIDSRDLFLLDTLQKDKVEQENIGIDFLTKLTQVEGYKYLNYIFQVKEGNGTKTKDILPLNQSMIAQEKSHSITKK